MREFWIIFKQAYITKAKAKSFIITTAIMVAAIFLFANITKIIDGVQDVMGDGDEPKTLYVIDESEVIADQLAVQLESSEAGIEVEVSDLTAEALTKQVTDGEIDSFLSVGLDSSNTITANYTTMSMMDISMPAMIQDALQSIQTEMKASELSLSGEQVQTLFTPIQFEQKNVSPSAKSEEELNQARVLVYVLMFVIYFAVILYSSMIATEVATEKVFTCDGDFDFKCFACEAYVCESAWHRLTWFDANYRLRPCWFCRI